MKPFSNPRTRRNTAFVAMLVWAFALASGMANACLLERPGKHAHTAASHPSNDHHTHAGDALAVDTTAVVPDDADASKEACLKACDDGSSAQVKPHAGVDLTDPGLAPVVAFAWHAATSIAAVPGWFDPLQAPVVGPPFRLRYSRLTL